MNLVPRLFVAGMLVVSGALAAAAQEMSPALKELAAAANREGAVTLSWSQTTLGGSQGRLQGATLNDRSNLDLNYQAGGVLDTVTTNFWNINKRANAHLNINLNGGNDKFAMNLPPAPNGDFDDGANFNLDVNGGGGNSTASFTGTAGRGFHTNIQDVTNSNIPNS